MSPSKIGNAASDTVADDGERFRTLANSIPHLAWMARPDGWVFWYNRRWYDYTGSTFDEMAGSGWRILHHPDHVDETAERYARAIAAGEDWEDTFQLRRHDGAFRWFLSRATPVRALDGKVKVWVGTNTDVTEQRAAEMRLEHETAALETLNRTGVTLGAELDPAHLIQLVTDAGIALAGAAYGAFLHNRAPLEPNRDDPRTSSELPNGSVAGFPLLESAALFEPTYRHGSIIRSDDILCDPRYQLETSRCGMLEGRSPLRSYLAVPVTTGAGRVLGGLFFGHGETGKFDERAERLIAGLAAQTAVALDNARLHKDALDEITRRSVVERALRDGEERLRATYENATIGITETDMEGRFLRVNAEFCRISGYSAEEATGLSIRSVTHPDDVERDLGQYARQLAGEIDGYQVEKRFIRKDGREIWVRIAASLARDADGRPAYGIRIMDDITERMRARETVKSLNETLEERVVERTRQLIESNERLKREIAERERTEEALRQAQKMEAVGQLTGGVAHDFNNLLTIIAGNLDLLVSRVDRPELKRLAGSALRGAERAASLTQQLLAFSRRQALSVRPVDLNRMVSDITELLRRTLGDGITIETALAEAPWRASTDVNQMETALLNLAINARDAMKGSGKLTIQTANIHLDEHYAAIHAETVPGDYVLLAVTDTGSGMTPETMAHVFEPFFTTKEVGQGSGLGLSMVYGFVKQSGGHIGLESAVGQGTTVRIHLPRFFGPDETDIPDPPPSPPVTSPRPTMTILVVEDNDEVRRFTVQTLRDLGYVILEADNADAALAQIEGAGPIDLLFTDVSLPRVNGRTLADEAQRRRPGLKVLFTSGYTRDAIVHDGMLDPDVDLIGKPFTARSLAARIRAVLER